MNSPRGDVHYLVNAKMAAVWMSVLIAVIFSINLNVKRCAFVSSDCIGLSLIGEEAEEFKYGESFISSSLWQARGGKFSFRMRTSKQSFLSILILMCGDVEQCPGPGYCRRSILELTSLLNNKGMKMFHQNVRGLFGNLGHVSELLQSFPGIDILSLSETDIEAGLEQDEAIYDIPGYSFINRPRKSSKGGGVGAYLVDGIRWDRRHDLENDKIEAIWLEIRPKHSKTFLVGIMYRPPDNKGRFCNTIASVALVHTSIQSD